MPSQTAQLPLRHWTDNDITAGLAEVFRNADMTDIDDCVDYLGVVGEFRPRHTYQGFRAAISAGIRTSAEIRSYADAGIHPVLAARFKKHGLTAHDVTRWLEVGIDLTKAASWLDVGLVDPAVASRWESEAGTHAQELFEAGFQLGSLPPVVDDLANSDYHLELATLLTAARRDNLTGLHTRLIRVYACPVRTLQAARVDRQLVEELIGTPDSVLRAALVIFEQECRGVAFGCHSPDTLRELIRQLT